MIGNSRRIQNCAQRKYSSFFFSFFIINTFILALHQIAFMWIDSFWCWHNFWSLHHFIHVNWSGQHVRCNSNGAHIHIFYEFSVMSNIVSLSVYLSVCIYLYVSEKTQSIAMRIHFRLIDRGQLYIWSEFHRLTVIDLI